MGWSHNRLKELWNPQEGGAGAGEGRRGQIMNVLACHTQELSVDFGLGAVGSH